MATTTAVRHALTDHRPARPAWGGTPRRRGISGSYRKHQRTRPHGRPWRLCRARSDTAEPLQDRTANICIRIWAWMASRLLLSPGQDLAAAQITPIWAELISIWTCQFPRISAAVCVLLQRGPITQRDEVRPATRSRQAAACTATSRT